MHPPPTHIHSFHSHIHSSLTHEQVSLAAGDSGFANPMNKKAWAPTVSIAGESKAGGGGSGRGGSGGGKSAALAALRSGGGGDGLARKGMSIMKTSGSSSPKAPPPVPRSSKPKPMVQPQARALYAYEALAPDELTLKVGDVVKVLDQTTDPDWWRGYCKGMEGLFPSNHVELV